MSNTIQGKCHCGNLSFELSTQIQLDEIQARACDCSFCRLHATKNWSDPNGKVTIRIDDDKRLHKYRFGLGTADFYVCQNCGAYLGAVFSDIDGTWSTVNLRLTELVVEEQAASYGSENASGRIARRKRVWTPTNVVAGS